MTVEIRTPTVGAGAAAALARTTGLLLEDASGDVLEDLLPDGRLDSAVGPLAAVDVAAGAGALLAKIIVDVEDVLAINRAETLHRLGLWIAGQGSGR